VLEAVIKCINFDLNASQSIDWFLSAEYIDLGVFKTEPRENI